MEKGRSRNWDWLTGMLMFLLMQVTAARLVTTNWAPNLYFAETLAAFGVILGLALGASHFRGRIAAWLAGLYTLLVIPWQLSSAATNKLLLDRLQSVGGILMVALGQFMRRQPVTDALFFVAFACLVFWLLSVLAGYAAARNRDLLAGIIPSAVILVTIQIFANYQVHGSWWLAAFLLVALLMVGRVYFLESERQWLERRVFINDEAWPNIMVGLFTIVAVAILAAWLLPTSISRVQAVADTWTRFTKATRDRLSNAVNPLTGPNGKPGTDFFGSSLGMGQNAATGDSTVFRVEVLKEPDSHLRYYWRGRVYDKYSDGRWSTTGASTRDFLPGTGNLQLPDIDNRSESQIRFLVQLPEQMLIYAPAETVWVDRPASVERAIGGSGLDDILAWESKRVIQNGNQYQVKSEIGNPDVVQLQSAPSSYPEWIQARYLEVPQKLRPKILALAEKVTAGAATPYDKAVAITRYLRLNLEYSATLPPIPEGRDPVDWVLFSYKKGFCNYYASAEVLMLRSVGVPARLAVGFAQGEYVNGGYTVRRRDAHAWPEVFFPGLGWVEFEPTASQQPLVRRDPALLAGGPSPIRPQRDPRELDDPTGSNSSQGSEATPSGPFSQTIPGRALLIAVLAFGTASLFYLIYRTHAIVFVPVLLSKAFESSGISAPAWLDNWLRWNRLQPVEQAFASVNWSLRLLAKPPAIHATPAQRASALKKLLPAAASDIDAVAGELEIGLFTPQPADASRARRAGFLVALHALRARLARSLGL